MRSYLFCSLVMLALALFLVISIYGLWLLATESSTAPSHSKTCNCLENKIFHTCKHISLRCQLTLAIPYSRFLSPSYHLFCSHQTNQPCRTYLHHPSIHPRDVFINSQQHTTILIDSQANPIECRGHCTIRIPAFRSRKECRAGRNHRRTHLSKHQAMLLLPPRSLRDERPLSKRSCQVVREEVSIVKVEFPSSNASHGSDKAF